MEECPKCGYNIKKFNLFAECAHRKCNFETSWKRYNNLIAQRNGFTNYDSAQEFSKSCIKQLLKDR